MVVSGEHFLRHESITLVQSKFQQRQLTEEEIVVTINMWAKGMTLGQTVQFEYDSEHTLSS